MDLSALSDSDLKAIAAGDMKSVSDDGLRQIAGVQAQPSPAHQLGQALYDAIHHAVRSASPFETGPVADAATSVAPDMARGALRLPPGPDDQPGGGIAYNAGKQAPVAAGTLAAGLALPAVAPAAAAASPLLAGAAASGLGAAAGNAAQQVASNAAGGEAPNNIPDALAESGKVGLAAAATDLGVGALVKGVSAVAPKFVSMFKSFPAEGLKRTLERPDEVLDVIANSKTPQIAAEKSGVSALREVQNGLTLARNQAGKQVESALNDFQAVTEGKPIIDGFEVSQAGAEALANRSTESGVSAISDSESKKIGDLVEGLNKQGPMSAKDAVVWRRKLDNMIDYKRGAVPEISSGEGQGIVAQMAKSLRQQIQSAADQAGFTPLAQANTQFGQIADAYDAYRPAFNTKTNLGSEAVKRLEALERMFNKGGLPQQDLTQIGQAIPALQDPVDRLLDSIVARRLTLESNGSPSSVAMSAIRFLAGPDGLATAANLMRRTPVSAIRRGAATAAATSVAGNQ